MEIGYNLINYRAIEEKKYEKLGKSLSIIEFMRKLKRDIIPENANVFGLEYLINYSDKPNIIAKLIRNLLREHSNKILQQGAIYQFIINANITKNKNFILVINHKRFPLNLIFGNRINYEDTDWLSVAPNI